MSDYYDWHGNAMDLMGWGKRFGRINRKVETRYLPNGYVVSTVWLGLNHAYGDGPPLIFETMVFRRYPKRWLRRDGRQQHERMDYAERDMNRYSTWQEAVAGHEAMVAKWRKAKPLRDTASRRKYHDTVHASRMFQIKSQDGSLLRELQEDTAKLRELRAEREAESGGDDAVG